MTPILVTACDNSQPYINGLVNLLASLRESNPDQFIHIYTYDFDGEFLRGINPNIFLTKKRIPLDVNRKIYMASRKPICVLDMFATYNFIAWIDVDTIVNYSILPIWKTLNTHDMAVTFREKQDEKRKFASGFVVLKNNEVIRNMVAEWHYLTENLQKWGSDQLNLWKAYQKFPAKCYKLTRAMHETCDDDKYKKSIIWHGKHNRRQHPNWLTNSSSKLLSALNSQVLKRPVDVVIPFRLSGSKVNNWELRYALRSLHANGHNLRHIIIMGGNPGFLKGVRIIPVNDTHVFNSEANIIHKVLSACDLPQLSDDFILMSDDHIILNEVNLASLLPMHKGRLTGKVTNNPYSSRVAHTSSHCLKHRLPDFNFDTHVPMLIDKHMYAKTMRQLSWDDDVLEGYLTKSIYGNACIGGGVEIEDAKKLMHGVPKEDASFMSLPKIPSTQSLRYLMEKFPDPSPYEIDDPVPPIKTYDAVRQKKSHSVAFPASMSMDEILKRTSSKKPNW